MYKFKQDLAMAYFDGCSKKTASRLLAREITLTPGLLAALQATGYSRPKTPLPPPTPNPLLLPRRALKRNRAPMSKIK